MARDTRWAQPKTQPVRPRRGGARGSGGGAGRGAVRGGARGGGRWREVSSQPVEQQLVESKQFPAKRGPDDADDVPADGVRCWLRLEDSKRRSPDSARPRAVSCFRVVLPHGLGDARRAPCRDGLKSQRVAVL